MNQQAVLEQCRGLTYRQLDTWTTAGHLYADHARPGSGFPRDWPEDEVVVARWMRFFTEFGIGLSLAEQLARVVAAGGTPQIKAFGLTVTVQPEEVAA